MREIREIPINLIIMDRYPINKKTLGLLDFIRQGGCVPPIKVAKNSVGNYTIRDGRHRITAYKMLGIEKIKARFSTISLYKKKT
jgi:ParB-like chromosome segregation protein Spo0J